MRRNNKHRSCSGQGVTEGVCISIAIALVFTLLIAFSVNAYMYCTCQAKLQMVANGAAKVFKDNDFWNGARRPKFQRTDEAQIVFKEGTGNECANAIAKEIGLTDGVTPRIYLCAYEHVEVPHENGRMSEFSKCTFILPYFNLPYKFAGLFPGILSLKATSISTQSTEEPPAFIRLGYNLTKGDPANPTNTTDVTQVCILPSYGFVTDPPKPGTEAATLGLNKANADVAANQPDDRYCGWNGLNVAIKPPTDNPKPRLVGNAPQQKNAEGGYVPYFGEQLK